MWVVLGMESLQTDIAVDCYKIKSFLCFQIDSQLMVSSITELFKVVYMYKQDCEFLKHGYIAEADSGTASSCNN